MDMLEMPTFIPEFIWWKILLCLFFGGKPDQPLPWESWLSYQRNDVNFILKAMENKSVKIWKRICNLFRSSIKHITSKNLTLAGTSHFAILHGTGGGWYDPPPARLAPNWARGSQKPSVCVSTRGSRCSPILRSKVNWWPQRSEQTLAAGRLRWLSSGGPKVDRND